jgi:DNA uptake protein ComE-like DNA-binding protein
MKFPANLQRPEHPVAQLGGTHGYRVDGDVVHLNADILCDESRLTGQTWALQLWSDHGIKIADLELGLLNPNGSGLMSVNGATTLLPPAGIGQHTLSLALVSGADGVCDTLEDSATYPQPVHFVQPRFRGHVGCQLQDGTIGLDLDAIENPREADNLSGTLALEVWALDAPYGGGSWCGVPVASLVLGTLAGQSDWSDCHFEAHAGPLPATGHLTLMLREWTPAGYLTRDYRILPVVAASVAEVAVTAEAKPEGQVDVKAALSPAAAKAEPASKARAPAAAKPVPAPKKVEAAPGKAPSAKLATAPSRAPSVNTASQAELSAVKGIGPVLAKAIIAARPYVSLDELTRAKGMGKLLLARVRAAIRL